MAADFAAVLAAALGGATNLPDGLAGIGGLGSPGGWQIDLLLWLQSVRHPALTLFMGGVTMLGDDLFYVAVLGLMYWKALGGANENRGLNGRSALNGKAKSGGSFNRQDVMDLMSLVVLSVLLNIVIKHVVAAPRPFEVVQALEGLWVFTAGSASFPSGHAQTAATFWVALLSSGKFFWSGGRRSSCQARRIGTALLMVALICVSRLYLGLHWPQDVLAGAALGTILGFSGPVLSKIFNRWSLIPTLALAATGILVFQDDGAVQLICLLAGAVFGHWQGSRGEMTQSGENLRRGGPIVPALSLTLTFSLGLVAVAGAYLATTWLLTLAGLPEMVVKAAAAAEIGLMVTWGGTRTF